MVASLVATPPVSCHTGQGSPIGLAHRNLPSLLGGTIASPHPWNRGCQTSCRRSYRTCECKQNYETLHILTFNENANQDTHLQIMCLDGLAAPLILTGQT